MTAMESRLCLMAILGLTGAFGTGCQTYTKKAENMTQLWRQGNVPEAVKQFSAKAEKEKNTKDTVIWRLEQGTALRATGQYAESNSAFEVAEEKINWHDEQAKISVSRETAALLSNQANLPYEGRDYDKVMLNTYKALNYLQLGDAEKARVELNRAYQRQQDAVENNKKRIEKAEEDLKKAKEKSEKDKAAVEMTEKAENDPGFKQQLEANFHYLGELKAYADYANPFTVYMDALFFETAATGASDLERARKSFERTLGFTGENKFIKQDLETIEQILSGSPIPPTTYVIFETGCAPMRDQIKIPVPLFLVGARNISYVGAAFPILKLQQGHLPTLNVAYGSVKESTVLLASMDSVVGHAFKNELPIIVTKTLASALLKAAAQYGINKGFEKEDVMTRLLIKVILALIQYSVDIADTRTWSTLPKEYQFCRIATPPDRKIEVSGPGGEPKVEVKIDEGTVNLILVKSISTGSPLLISQVKLK